MPLRHLFASLLLALGLAISSSPAAAQTHAPLLILDILPLHEGKTVADAEAYFEKVEPILARHGMTRSDSTLEVRTTVRGAIDAQVVNLWETRDPQASFQGVFADPDYLKHAALRDSIFDLANANILITARRGK